MQDAIAVISDIHSNFEALTAVLDDIQSQGVSQIVCLGDIVGYASSVKSCMRVIRELDCRVILGNHDEAACLSKPPADFNDTAAAGVLFASSRLSPPARSRSGNKRFPVRWSFACLPSQSGLRNGNGSWRIHHLRSCSQAEVCGGMEFLR